MQGGACVVPLGTFRGVGFVTDLQTRIARRVADSGHAFKSNTAHARFAAAMACEVAPKCGVAFMEAARPSWTVGSARGNVWEQQTRRVDATLNDHGPGCDGIYNCTCGAL